MNNRWRLSLVLLLFVTLGVYVDWKQYSDADFHETLQEHLDAKETWILDHALLKGDTVITIAQDVVFKGPKTYRAFPLVANLLANLNLETTHTDLEVVFKCLDGYAPHMPLEKVLSGKGFLAYKDLDIKTNENWADSLSQKLSPFYLVWQNADQESYVWPYALTEIQLKSSKEAFQAALPENKKHYRGFELFSTHCMKCHSVNKVGGTMGPEFNFPTNITTYWTKDNIRKFIKEPTAYRYNSKMPPIGQTINNDQFEAIYDYLESMKDKVLVED